MTRDPVPTLFWTLHTYLPESAARAPTTLSTEWRGNSEGEADTGTLDPVPGCTCSGGKYLVPQID